MIWTRAKPLTKSEPCAALPLLHGLEPIFAHYRRSAGRGVLTITSIIVLQPNYRRITANNATSIESVWKQAGSGWVEMWGIVRRRTPSICGWGQRSFQRRVSVASAFGYFCRDGKSIIKSKMTFWWCLKYNVHRTLYFHQCGNGKSDNKKKRKNRFLYL